MDSSPSDSSGPGPGAPPSRSVLVVDDQPEVLLLVELTFRRAGYEVVASAHPARVEALLGSRRFDAMVLDLSLPGIPGLELLRRLRAEPETRDLPVLILSGFGEATHRVRGLRAGANDYMIKPFEPAELLARVEKLIAGGGVGRAGPAGDGAAR